MTLSMQLSFLCKTSKCISVMQQHHLELQFNNIIGHKKKKTKHEPRRVCSLLELVIFHSNITVRIQIWWEEHQTSTCTGNLQPIRTELDRMYHVWTNQLDLQILTCLHVILVSK